MNKPKLTFDEIKDLFEERGCTLISEYYTSKEKLKYTASCGHYREVALHYFKKGKGDKCRKCAYADSASPRRRSYEEIKREFESHGCKLLSETYTNNSTPLDFICACGKKSKTAYAAFRLSGNCNDCGNRKISKALKRSIEDIRAIFTNAGFILLEDEYVNKKKKMKFICVCGSLHSMAVDGVLQGNRCLKCKSKSLSGPNHYLFNPSLTEEQRIANASRASTPGQKRWKLRVLKRDYFTCQCCGFKRGVREDSLRVHHLDGYNWCEDRREDDTNGVTLCNTCHIGFHNENGYGDNTESQFIKWLQLRKEREDIPAPFLRPKTGEVV